ncbi:MAG: discoidin domain-containing protein [Byssovorax sp.]
MQKPWLTRRPWLPSTITWLAYALGVVWRWLHLTKWHDPRLFSQPELDGYLTLARRLAAPGYVLKVGDVPTAPGSTWLLELFLRRDPSLLQQVHFNFLICALLPLAVGALGWVTFGKRTAQASVVVASAYAAFVDCAAYFTPDVHLALFATLTFAAYLQAMKLVAEEPSPRRTASFVGLAALGGLCFSIATAMSTVAIPAVLGFCAVHFLFTRGPKPRRKALVLAAFLVASLPLTVKVASRCTTANGGHFCLSSNTTEARFLLGHYDRTAGIEWHDPSSRGEVAILNNVGGQQHGFRSNKVVSFAITDQASNSDYAWGWIKQNPSKAIILSLEHVWDCFGGTYPWPGLLAEQWAGSYAGHFLFLAFILLPAAIVLLDLLRQRGFLGLIRSMEFAVISPILGVCAAAFAATGEDRHRIPWDGVFIVLSVQFYRRFHTALETPAPVAEGAVVPEPEDDPQELAQANRRVRMVLLFAGALAVGGAIRGIIWAMPDTHRFRASSGAWGFPAEGIVGDHGDRGLFFHTAEEEDPWVEIDLGALRDVEQVKIENRDDVGMDRCLPLVVELGDPDHHFHEVARRTEAFDRWTATFPKEKARYLRLHVPRRTLFHLKNVQAF